MSIVITNLTKRYKDILALDHISLIINPGIHGLLGANGAGKTTLMRILATILDSDNGEITWGDSISWRYPMQIKGTFGYLPQQFGMYKYLKVEEALKGVALLKDIPKAKEKEQVRLAMERAHLTEYAHRKVGQLSGGMLRRLGIAQAFLGEPPLLIMDEPSVGLDPEERINLRKTLRDYVIGERIVLISSHIVTDIESLCDEVTVLHKGKVLVNGCTHIVQAAAEHRVKDEIMSDQALRQLEKTNIVIHFSPVAEGFRVRYLTNELTAKCSSLPTLEDSYTYLVNKDKIV